MRNYRYKRNAMWEIFNKGRGCTPRNNRPLQIKTTEFWSRYGKGILLFLLIFTIGFIIGSINAAKLLPEEKIEAQNYILLFTESIKTKNIDLSLLMKDAILSNIKQVLFPWIIGLIIIGIPLVFGYIALEGYMLGFTVTSVIASLGMIRGSTFLITSVIPKQMIFIPMLFFISISAITFSSKILRDRNSNIANFFYRYFLVLIVSLLIAIGIALFEIYIGFPLTKFLIKIFVP